MQAIHPIPNPASNPATDAVNPGQAKQRAVESLEVRSFEVALANFCSDTRERFEGRFPGLSYESDQYDFKKDSGKTDKWGRRLTLQALHVTKAVSSKPVLVTDALRDLHPSFSLAARAVLAYRVLQKQNKGTGRLEYGLRLLKNLESVPHADRPTELHELTITHLRHIEKCVLTSCLSPEVHKALERNDQRIEHLVVNVVEQRGADAFGNRKYLQALYDSVGLLASHGALVAVNFRLSHEVSDILKLIEEQQRKAFWQKKEAELEPGIAALSEAITAMANDDTRLSPIQQAVLCVMGLEMCAPSRINEILTMSIHDRLVSVDAYKDEPDGDPTPDESPEAARVEEANAGIRVRTALHKAHASIREASEPNPMDALPNTMLMKG